jgi:hypothetical protein
LNPTEEDPSPLSGGGHSLFIFVSLFFYEEKKKKGEEKEIKRQLYPSYLTK